MKLKNRYHYDRPSRAQLGGLSRSEFKTLLKRNGHKIRREFYQYSCLSEYNGRYFRWRWWSDIPEVDISEPKEQFDRWANSVEDIKPFIGLIQILRGDNYEQV